ncbi:MAG: protein phosphatase 2C domain-containing protein [Chloroflexota bacterium]
MIITSAYKSDIGKRRQNEDYVWVDERAGLFIVADGMGGHEAGEVASELASTTVGTLLRDQLRTANGKLSQDSIETMMTNALEEANETVVQEAKKADQARKMGSTIVVTLLRASTAYITHAGDARAYLIRGTTIMQLTEDDSWQAQFGVKSDAKKSEISKKFEHFVTKAIGQNSKINPSFTTIKVATNDWLLLCSDGLWNVVSDEEMLTMLQNANSNPQQAVDALVGAANAAQGKDNISVALIKIK